MTAIPIFTTALITVGFAFAVIHVIVQTSNKTIEDLQLENEQLELDKINLESRIEALCKMLEVQDNLLREATEPSLHIEVTEPIFEAKKPI